jgi:hypothetical protein
MKLPSTHQLGDTISYRVMNDAPMQLITTGQVIGVLFMDGKVFYTVLTENGAVEKDVDSAFIIDRAAPIDLAAQLYEISAIFAK